MDIKNEESLCLIIIKEKKIGGVSNELYTHIKVLGETLVVRKNVIDFLD